MNAKIISFPRDRKKPIEPHEAQIIKFPIKEMDVVFLMPLAMAGWAGLFVEIWTTAF